MENQELVKREQSAIEGALSVRAVTDQINLIQNIMKTAMKDGEHYGTIPGCGDKKVLLKAGAEKLNLTFRFCHEFDIDIIDMENYQREYRIKCYVRSINKDTMLGMGVGSCSTMEKKYRYTTGPKESIGKAVPQEYWNLRKSDPVKAQSLLGGKGFSTGKNPDGGAWEIMIQGEKMENENPADFYNTCLKMAKKRAMVDAVLTVTAASDIFTQDLEDGQESSAENKADEKRVREEQRDMGTSDNKKPKTTPPEAKQPEEKPQAEYTQDQENMILQIYDMAGEMKISNVQTQKRIVDLGPEQALEAITQKYHEFLAGKK